MYEKSLKVWLSPADKARRKAARKARGARKA